MNKRTLKHQRKEAGFSLVEIMVAVVISMIAMVLILQIFGSSEARKRATTGSNDAMTGGVIALAGLQRDVRQAGYGMASMPLLGCGLALPSGGTLPALAPVTINPPVTVIPAGDTNTDTLLVMYGVSDGAPEGDLINTQPGGDQYFAMATPTSFQLNDWVVAEPQVRPASCSLTLTQVIAAAASNSSTIKLQTGASGMAFGTLYNLGHDNADATLGPQFRAYRVRNGNLTVCDYMANNCGNAALKDNDSIWIPIASNIVSLRAQYGRDTTSPSMDGIVDLYDRTSPSSTNAATFACEIYRISAVRMALVARSADYDKDAPTANAPAWEGTATDDMGSEALPIDVSSAPMPSSATWHNYRYKVFQAVTPIRTVTSLGPQSGC